MDYRYQFKEHVWAYCVQICFCGGIHSTITEESVMKKFDVFVELPDGGDELQWCGTYEGYIGDIAAAILTLYPQAIGITIEFEKAE